MKKQLESSNILPHYVFMHCRAPSLMDRFLGQPLTIARRAFAWGSNRLFSRAQCPECLQTFNRAHLRRCNVYENLGIRASVLDHDSFKSDLERISRELQDPTREFHYTILDYYLNCQNYNGFSSVVELLKTLLYGKTRPDNQHL